MAKKISIKVMISRPRQSTLGQRFQKGFIRFSVGLEDPDDIIRDLDQALSEIGL